MSETNGEKKGSRQIELIGKQVQRRYREFRHELLGKDPIWIQSLTQGEKIAFGKKAAAGKANNLDHAATVAFELGRACLLNKEKTEMLLGPADRDIWDGLDGELVAELQEEMLVHTGLKGDEEKEAAKN